MKLGFRYSGCIAMACAWLSAWQRSIRWAIIASTLNSIACRADLGATKLQAEVGDVLRGLAGIEGAPVQDTRQIQAGMRGVDDLCARIDSRDGRLYLLHKLRAGHQICLQTGSIQETDTSMKHMPVRHVSRPEKA